MKTLILVKDTQQERRLGEAMSFMSSLMIHVSDPIAGGIFSPSCRKRMQAL